MLRGSESRTLPAVGAFRVISADDLRDAFDKPSIRVTASSGTSGSPTPPSRISWPCYVNRLGCSTQCRPEEVGNARAGPVQPRCGPMDARARRIVPELSQRSADHSLVG